jgi:dipeptidyl aminopeptidase/acylaminoacyl peptidase
LTIAIAAASLLTLHAFRQLVFVRDPQISPDGRSVVYVRSRADFKHDRYDNELVVVSVKGGTPRILSRGNAGISSPRWSPDGTRIAYLAAPAEKKPRQIFVLSMNGGTLRQVTHSDQSVLSFAWRPDGDAFAYVREDEPDKAALRRHYHAVEITDEDYLTESTPLPAHLWEIDANGEHDKRLNAGSWSVVKNSAGPFAPEPVWSPDGSRIYYQRQPDAVFAHFVSETTHAYDVRTRRDIALNFGVDEMPRFSRDGRFLAVVVPRHGSLYLQRDVSVRSVASGREVFSSRAVDRNVHWFAFMPNDSLAFAAADGVRNRLWIIPERGAATEVNLGGVDFAPDASVGRDGAIAFVGLRRDHPADIYYLASGSHEPRRLTDENSWLNHYAVGKSVEVRWRIGNGMTADGVLTYPVGYVAGRRYPLVLDVHGGPVETSTWDMTGLEGGELAQLFAAKGDLVFRPNYRGSDNSGDAFLQAIVGDVSSGPGSDILAGVGAIRRMGIVDESRIFVSGWSGGGLQTSWLISHATFWRAAVSGAAVDDWYEQTLFADINEPFGAAFFKGMLPFSPQGRAAYARESPISYADRVKTPTLILSDAHDPRVPVTQSYAFYHALRDHGVHVEFLAFPRYGHFPEDPVERDHVLQAWTGWIEQWTR